MGKKLKVLVLFDTAGSPPLDQDFTRELKTSDWKTERHVIAALKNLGHDVSHAGIYDDLEPLSRAIKEQAPDIIFNLVEHFGGKRAWDSHVAAFLELAGIPYTGSGPTGMFLCRDKGICKKILSYHRICNPRFNVFSMGQTVNSSRNLKFPLFVKPMREDASQGIALSSFVSDDAALKERVSFIHENISDDALAEEYVDGRELYASVLGNDKLTVFPLREIVFDNVPDDEPKIATYKAKWDRSYRQKWGITNRFAERLEPKLQRQIEDTCKKLYRLLHIRGWGRIDLRLTAEGEIIIIEANPNPFLASDEDFAKSAKKAGISYDELIGKILLLGMKGKEL